MDVELYQRRIMAMPVEKLSSLIEEDPEAAEEWSDTVEKLAEEYAAENGIEPDEITEEHILEQILAAIKANDTPPCFAGSKPHSRPSSAAAGRRAVKHFGI